MIRTWIAAPIKRVSEGGDSLEWLNGGTKGESITEFIQVGGFTL